MVQWPPCRVLLALAAVLGVQLGILQLLLVAVPKRLFAPGLAADLRFDAALLVAVVAMHWAYRGYVRWIEWRPASEVSRVGAAPEAARGLAIGAGLMSAAVAVLGLAGFYHVAGMRPAEGMVPILGIALISGYGEELLVRVILFRILEEMVGTGWALAVTGALFGLAHLNNPHATLVSAVSITFAGVLLGAAYALTRRIWLAAGLHAGWNFFQGGIFGVAISGVEGHGLLNASLTGPPALSGGPFGVEGSVVAVVLCAAAAVPLLAAAARRGNVVPPPWRARRARAAAPAASAT